MIFEALIFASYRRAHNPQKPKDKAYQRSLPSDIIGRFIT
jgi:hypothetical protein